MILEIPENITWKNLKLGIVLLKLDSGEYFTLNETATLVWRGIIDGKSESEILENFNEEYDCLVDSVKEDIRVNIEYLLKEKLLINKAV